MKVKEITPINVFVRDLNDFHSEIAPIRSVYRTKIKFWFPQISISDSRISQWKDAEEIETKTTDKSLTYIQWDLDKCICNILYDERIHLAERTKFSNFLMLDKNNYNKDSFIMFRDAKHKKELPDAFIKIHSFKSFDSLLTYCRDEGLFGFSIEDTSFFTKDSQLSVKEGTYVAKEIKTGYFWYLDLLHKNHYEVFDNTGKKHIGEANLNGEMIPDSADKKKHLL